VLIVIADLSFVLASQRVMIRLLVRLS